MDNLKSIVLHLAIYATISLSYSGCASLKEGLTSQLEVPTLEKQVNRVAIGMTIVRENNIMAVKMPVSADAQWPAQIASSISDQQVKIIKSALKQDPYYATIAYSEPIQRKMLGSSNGVDALSDAAGFDVGTIAGAVNDDISPLTYKTMQTILVLYGQDKKNWPDTFDFDPSLKNFLDFKNGELTMVEAASGDVYETLDEALIAITPVNYQKDLTQAKNEMLKAYQKAASLEGEKGLYQAKRQGLKQTSSNTADINDLDVKISEAKQAADEKEQIYFTLLDNAVTALQSDIRLDNEQVKLARNINIITKQIQIGAGEAYSSFAIASGNILNQHLLQHFDKELKSLAFAAMKHPRYARQFKERIARLTKNALYFFPNIGMGSYYAYKQSVLARKYETITDLIVQAANARNYADKAAKTKQ